MKSLNSFCVIYVCANTWTQKHQLRKTHLKMELQILYVAKIGKDKLMVENWYKSV